MVREQRALRTLFLLPNILLNISWSQLVKRFLTKKMYIGQHIISDFCLTTHFKM